jgi:hypothetical protein
MRPIEAHSPYGLWELLGAVVLCWAITPSMTAAAPPLEYCGSRKADQQLGAVPHPERNRDAQPHVDCTPFIEKKGMDEGAPADDRKAVRPPRELKVENLPTEISKFLQEYRQFMECCKSDPAELERVEELGDEVADLLRLAQTGLFSEQMKLRGITLREMIAPVASARRELGLLRKQLEQLGTLMEKRDSSGYEEAGQETILIQETEEALQKEAPPRNLPSGPKTGLEIGTTPAAGKAIGKTPTTGTAIGSEGLAGPRIGVNPKTGKEIGVTGATGFEIGATGRAGPDIGESTLNSGASSSVGSSLAPSTIGSTLQDSTVESTIGTSTTGSSLSDSTIGSSLGGSSVGSSLQNRSTGP